MSVPSRVAVRILVLDPSSRVLLFEGRDLSDSTDTVRYWFTAGGGVEAGESLTAAGERELHEETGYVNLALAGPFERRDVAFHNHGEPLHQTEHYFAARVADPSTLHRGGWTELERKAMTRSRWWSTEELRTSAVTYFPQDLPDLIERASVLV